MKRFFALLLLMPTLDSAAMNAYQPYEVFSPVIARVSLPYYYREVPPPQHHYRHRHEKNVVVRNPRGHNPWIPLAPSAHGHDNHANNLHGHKNRGYFPPHSHRPNENPSSRAHAHD